MISSPQFKSATGVHGHHHCVPKGLKNLGNSCYMNAVMQALAVSDYLYQSVRRSNHSSHCQLTDCVLCSLERCISDLRRPIPLTRNFHPMMRLVRLLPRLSLDGAVMTSGRQEDAHEFLSHLITAAVEDGNAVIDTKAGNISPDNNQKNKPTLQDANYLHTLFDGSLCSSVRCKQCGTVSRTVEAVQGLELEVAHAGTLQSALEGFCRTEELDRDTDNAYDCAVCKEHTAAQKTLSLLKTPKLLRIQMKRFVYSETGSRTSKLSHLVEFPEQLDLTPFMASPDLSNSRIDKLEVQDENHLELYGKLQPPLYRLSAVVVHLGQGLHSGHYTAYVHPRSSTGQHAACPWYFVSDDTVRRVPLTEVLAQSAYMLFYEQVLAEDNGVEIPPVGAENRQFVSPKSVEKRSLSFQAVTAGGSLSDRLNRNHPYSQPMPVQRDYDNAVVNGERSTAYQRHYEQQQAGSGVKDSRFGSNPLFSPSGAASATRPVNHKIPSIPYHAEIQQRAARTFSVRSSSNESITSEEGGASAPACVSTSHASSVGASVESNKRPRHSYFGLPSFTLSKKRLFNSVNLFSGNKRRRDVGELGPHHLATPGPTQASNNNKHHSASKSAGETHLASTFFAQQQFDQDHTGMGSHEEMSLEDRENKDDRATSGEDAKRRRVSEITTPTSPVEAVGTAAGVLEAAQGTPTVSTIKSTAITNTVPTSQFQLHDPKRHISVDIIRANRKKGASWLSYLPNKIKALFA